MPAHGADAQWTGERGRKGATFWLLAASCPKLLLSEGFFHLGVERKTVLISK